LQWSEWVTSGREGAGLKEEYGEEWSILIIKAGIKREVDGCKLPMFQVGHPRLAQSI
jgi:hypothetical protein